MEGKQAHEAKKWANGGKISLIWSNCMFGWKKKQEEGIDFEEMMGNLNARQVHSGQHSLQPKQSRAIKKYGDSHFILGHTLGAAKFGTILLKNLNMMFENDEIDKREYEFYTKMIMYHLKIVRKEIDESQVDLINYTMELYDAFPKDK